MNLNGKWTLSVIEENDFKGVFDKYNTIEGEVPGNFELDLFREGIIPDPYYDVNILEVQKYERSHLIYKKLFQWNGAEADLEFKGIDTVAEIFLNGEKIGENENMFIENIIRCTPKNGENILTVHILPAVVEGEKYEHEPYESFLDNHLEHLNIRKAPHMYGWDIMPRVVSGGIWKDVSITEAKKSRILSARFMTLSVSENSAVVAVESELENINQDSTLKVYGFCGESKFEAVLSQNENVASAEITVENPMLWNPVNYGEPNLYEITVSAVHDGETVDSYTFKSGIRTVELVRTSIIDENGNGDFHFKINGKKVFVLGSNWVPVDAFHSRDRERLPEILPMINDIGCNALRCWGGNVYEDDIFYDYCDAHGIMIWQDFSMACGYYPQSESFYNKMYTEAKAVVRRLRNHPSIILWAGDNECDDTIKSKKIDPNTNVITRKAIPAAISEQDSYKGMDTRPYLPSSPYCDEVAYETQRPMSEEHLWGPRDYFKGNFYKTSVCCFASETGYHGCPSPESLKKFIAPENLWPYRESGKTYANKAWLAHATCAKPEPTHGFAYRIPLMTNQIVTLFGSEPDDLKTYALQSQISQAEAKKYFIERFRVTKWRRTGIIWWNLIDGWPQISDAIVDWYGTKKLAYSYIKRSQKPVCCIFDEPAEGKISLYGVNDLAENKNLCVKVTDLTSHEVLFETSVSAKANDSTLIKTVDCPENKHFLYIEWSGEDFGTNHYVTDCINLNFNDYAKAASEVGYLDALEGFSDLELTK